MATYTKINSSTTGLTLASGYYYVDSNVTCSNTNGNGITIGANNVKIYIKEGCSLTVTAKDGSGTSAGYAGIYLTTGTLQIYGNGTITVTGGKGGAGGNHGSMSWSTGSATPGTFRAPSGGTGGGGAGAGIGTNGGTGGSGGSLTGSGNKSATKGTSGGAGGAAGTYNGTVYIASSLTATISGGAAGSDGASNASGGTSYTDKYYSTHYFKYSAVAAASGGLAGASIGTGGGGAGGAGSAGVFIGGNSSTMPGDTGDAGASTNAVESGSINLGYFIMDKQSCSDNGTLSTTYIDSNSSGSYLIPRISGLDFTYTVLPKGSEGFNTSADGTGTEVIDKTGLPYALYFDSGSIIDNGDADIILYAVVPSGSNAWIKIAGKWYNGQAFVKVNGDWKTGNFQLKKNSEWVK